MRIPISAAALAVGGSLALAGLIAPAAHAADPAQECRGLGVANLYGEFIEGDDTHTPDAEGAVAVGGNADFTGGFSVGQELTAAQVDALPGKNALVVAGKITGHNTQVMKGNGVFGAKADGAVAQAHQGTVAQGPSPIDFKAEFAKLRAASTSLAAVAQTSGATVQAEGAKLTLTGGDAKYNSFTVDAAKLQGAKDVFLKVPAGSVTVVNVTGGSYDMAAAGTTGFHLWDEGKKAFVLDDKLQSAQGGAIRSKLLWNFPTATKVVKNSQAAWAGTVLAPNAAFDLGSGGPVNGSVIAASLTGKGGAETHHYPFTGCLPGTVPTPSVPPTVPATVPPTVPSGSPSATPSGSTAPSGSASPSGSPSAAPTGSAKPSASGSASPSAGASTSAPAAAGSPSASPDAGGNLAHTGSGPVLPLAIGGAVVLAAGGGIVVAARRKAAKRA
ncbi:choice-of-anchor A family protein [Streptomyces sp. CBMA156]|uniref:choice-of-anchor A family protein n=1 Tax=Streptomyces sp. CBMA156 TaxID=1930280 RepID=UPI0016620844|nr:choice-of-anchor A family protein [Streptomyces sp. CBMA156]MBD0675421.1 cell wall protein [Streptomyces sp. CBMA156]